VNRSKIARGQHVKGPTCKESIMANSARQFSISIAPNHLRTSLFTLALVLALSATPAAQAQTYQVLYAFHGADGSSPVGITMDRAGNLYGATYAGGSSGSGTVFQLIHRGSGWVLNPLHQFAGGNDGLNPDAKVVFGPDGTLYGTTYAGGNHGNCPEGCGTVFNLRPPPNVCRTTLCPWTENVIYRFEGGTQDGGSPASDVTFDANGNFYGTTYFGGNSPLCNDGGCGTVYEFSPSNGGWTETIIYSFVAGGPAHPFTGVVLDNLGDLYGTTTFTSAVYELTPSGNGWSETTLFDFDDLGSGGVIRDSSGNLYGITGQGGVDPGIVYELSSTGGGWTLTQLYNFGSGGEMPNTTLAMDAAGNLYGVTTTGGQSGFGTVFKLTKSGGSWTYTLLYNFPGGLHGLNPMGQVILDSSGNVYGVAEGGQFGDGVVFEITP
jgi:uncharacterized repeat protein (TIGR03803 family)